jgi:hypothetical protein
MGIKALTHNNLGKNVTPTSRDDWKSWVSATATRNYMLRNTLLDWLNLYGEKNGFIPDYLLDGWKKELEFAPFIMTKGQEFEKIVFENLSKKIQIITVHRIDNKGILSQAIETLELMKSGIPAIYQGTLMDAESQTYGTPDFLIRSDYLKQLFPDIITADAATHSAKDLGLNLWHYVVVDCKFSSLPLSQNGVLRSLGSKPAYKAQLFIYTQALGSAQGYTPKWSYLLGRSWEQGKGSSKIRVNNALSKLALMPQDSSLRGDTLENWVNRACTWIRYLRNNGSAWSVFPKPTIDELWPNLSIDNDYPWRYEKKQIARKLDDITMLWGVGFSAQELAHKQEIFSWKDLNCTPESLGVPSGKRQSVLQSILDINRIPKTPIVLPAQVISSRDIWYKSEAVEFYVDFEMINDLADNFENFPDKGGQTLIFMIGCGHLDKDDEWQFYSFVVSDLTQKSENIIIQKWIDHMKTISVEYGMINDRPLVFNWSKAEEQVLETNFNAAKVRHDWQQPANIRWFDFLSEVIREEPVSIQGAFTFGLKEIAKALHSHKLIKTSWGNSYLDGLGAMVGAILSAEESANTKKNLMEMPLMKEIANYNEIDCRVMMEIVQYLRRVH